MSVTVLTEAQTLVVDESAGAPSSVTVEADDEAAVTVISETRVSTVTVEQAAQSVLVVSSGEPGPPGPRGVPGGAYSHDQAFAAATWDVTHNLGFKPGGVTAYDSSGRQVDGVVEHVDTAHLRIHFSSPFTGEAEVS